MTDKNEVNKTQNKTLITGSLIVSVIAALAVSWVSFAKIKAVEEKLDHRPPIVVVDFVSLVESYGDLPPSELEGRMLETRDAVSALRDAGYLVLDAATTVAVPEDLILTSVDVLTGGN